MSAIEGEGLKNLCQFLLDTGRKYGPIDISDLLSHPTTISRHVEKSTKDMRNKFFKDLFFIINKLLQPVICGLIIIVRIVKCR